MSVKDLWSYVQTKGLENEEILLGIAIILQKGQTQKVGAEKQKKVSALLWTC